MDADYSLAVTLSSGKRSDIIIEVTDDGLVALTQVGNMIYVDLSDLPAFCNAVQRFAQLLLSLPKPDPRT